MKKRIVTLMTALAMLCSAVIPPGMELQAAEVKAKTTGTAYYVSTINGKDSNSGTSQDAPFYSLQKINQLDLNPGDQILLECGSVFTNGYLHLFGQSGIAEAPIVVDQYGTGADPVIDTNGQGVWFQNYGYRLDNAGHQYQGYVSSSILLYDSEYIEIQNLEIVNRNTEIDTVYNAEDMMDRTGVAAVAQDKGTIDHIHLKNLNVHDVEGNVYNKHMNNGGIYFTVFMPHDAVTGDKTDGTKDFVSSQTGVSRFNDVRIEDCSVVNTNRWGIAVGYTALWGKFADDKVISDEDIAAYGSTNVVIQNNYVKDAGGDAITLMYCDKPLVQYNISDGAARQMNSGDYAAKGEWQRFAAGIWPWKCKDAIFQYNEAFDTKNVNNENGDGQAWDADWSDGTIYQYNYSHHNEGGCLMVCLDEAYRTTFRYNISQNDMRALLDPFGSPKAHIYNNVFYVAEDVPIYRTRSSGETLLENNIFYYAGETAREEDWTVGNNKTYSNNLYYNYANVPTDAGAVNVAKGTQVFENPGNAPSSTTGRLNEHEDPETVSAFDGYRLSEGSPAIGAGKAIEDANGYDGSALDFFGNDLTEVDVFDIGAHQHQEKKGDDRPQKPSKPIIGETTKNTAQISWTAAGAAAGITGYRIKNGDEVLKELTGEELAAATDGQTITITLDNLEAGTEYTLTVVAYNEKGVESASQTISFKTEGDNPDNPDDPDKPEKPSEPEIGEPTETSVQISWKAAADTAGIKGYKVKDGDKVLKDLTGEELAAAMDGQTIAITLDNLEAGTEYTLTVVAYDEDGTESEPQVITFKTAGIQQGNGDEKPQKPSLPTVSGIKQTEAIVSWTAADDEASVKGYKIRNGNTVLLDLTGASLTAATNAGTKVISAKLQNLTAGTKYALTLTAYNQDGTESDPQEFAFTTEKAAANVQTPSMKLNKKSLTLYTKGKKSETLKLTVANISGAVKWTSSKPKVAMVSKGKVTAKKAGKTVITAQVGNYKASCTVTVKKPSIKVKKSVSVRKGKTLKLKAKAVPKGKITYKSSNKKIATVNKKGVVKGVKKGNCKLTLKCNGVKKTVKVKVK